MRDISGTFRSSNDADNTVRRLREAGFRMDQIGIEEGPSDLTLTSGREATPAGTHTHRVTVTVHAGNRAGEARAILERCGGYDVNVGDETERAVRESVKSDVADTPFGVTGDVANGLT